MEYTKSLTNYNRNQTLVVNVGNTALGGNNPIKIQTMCNTATNDVDKTVNQIINVAKTTDCDIIRVTVPTMNDVKALKEIHDKIQAAGVTIPLVADVHFNAAIAFECAKIVEKVRVNPGNFGHHELPCLTEEEFQEEGKLLEDTFRDFLKVCKEHNTAVRIGTNHGSLAKRILNRYGDTIEGMVESVMEFLRVAVQEKFENIAISLKSSNPTVAIRAARLMVKTMNDENMHYALHLGVTEAGEGNDGRIKSASGICPLLNDGIGDTIRVSLTEDPEAEILPAKEIVAYRDYLQEAAKLPEIPFFYDPFHYNKRKSEQISFLANNINPVAIIIDNETELQELVSNWETLKSENKTPDLIIAGNSDIEEKVISVIRESKVATKSGLHGSIKVFVDRDFVDYKQDAIIIIDENTDFETLKTQNLNKVTLIASPKNRNKTGALRYIFYKLQENNINNAVLLRTDDGEQDARFKEFAPAAECAGVFADGFGDGVCLKSNGNAAKSIRLGYQILQIARLRISGNEYVSCPGCGRTMYNLQETVKKIKAATAKYKNLKIAVMGCIVNGPGEMADADFGYVGAGKQKISLYKDGKVVKKAIDESLAVDELLKIIDNSI